MTLNAKVWLREISTWISSRFIKQSVSPQSVTTDWINPFCKLAIANTLSNLMVPLAGLIDTAFLGHLDDIRYLNGVALASVIFNVIYWSFNFFRMGTTGPTAQAIGSAVKRSQKGGANRSNSDEAEVWLIVLRNSLLALAAGLLIYLFKGLIATLAFTLLQAGEGARAAAIDFYNGRIIGAPAVLVNYVLLGWLLGRSKGRAVVLLAVVANVSNILLDYTFIRQLGWGSYGAGLATALSQYLMLLVGLSLIAAEGVPWQLWSQVKAKLWRLSELRSLFGLNRDILIRTFALVISMSLFTNFSSGLGETVLGVNTLLLQIVLMAAYFMDGIALAVESYAGNFYGQRATGNMLSLLILGAAGSVALGGIIALTLTLFPIPFFSLLTRHTILLEQIPRYVSWLFPVLCFGGVAFTLDGYFLGLTAGRTLRNSTLIAALCGFLPLAIAASWLQNSHLLWLALAGLMVMRVMTLLRQVPKTLNYQTLNHMPDQ